MKSATDSRRRCENSRWAVRMLFALVVVYFCIGMAVRKTAGEPYPGLFMPSFAGIGLDKMEDGRGQTLVCHVRIDFKDGTSRAVSLTEISPPDIFELSLLWQIFLTEGDAEQAKLSPWDRIRMVIAAIEGRRPAVDSSKTRPVPPDLAALVGRRAAELFPGRGVRAVTFTIYRVSFPLDHPREQEAVGVMNSATIDLP